MAHFGLTFEKFQYLRDHKINLEANFNIKIILPQVFINPIVTFATVDGEKKDLQNLKNLLRQKTVERTNYVMGKRIPVITLSDTEDETPPLCETNHDKKNKKKRKKSPDGDCSSVAVVDEPSSSESSEIQTIPKSKRVKTESASTGSASAASASAASTTAASTSTRSVSAGSASVASASVASASAASASAASASAASASAASASAASASAASASTRSVSAGSASTKSASDDSIVIIEETVHNKSNTSKESHGSIILLGNSTTESIPRPMRALLRPIVIDGANVAKEHGKFQNTFSCRGIQISVRHFLERGHTQVMVCFPKWRILHSINTCPTTDEHVLGELERSPHVTIRPSERIDGPKMGYDHRFIVQLATDTGGVLLSNKTYEDIMKGENVSLKTTVAKRLLMFCFVGDIFMIPDDPLGRHGPHLKDFLQFPENERP